MAVEATLNAGIDPVTTTGETLKRNALDKRSLNDAIALFASLASSAIILANDTNRHCRIVLRDLLILC